MDSPGNEKKKISKHYILELHSYALLQDTLIYNRGFSLVEETFFQTNILLAVFFVLFFCIFFWLNPGEKK